MDHFETNAIADAQGYVHVRVHVGVPGRAVHVSVDALDGDTSSHDWSPIVRTEGVCGGRACVAGTRLAVWLLEALRRDGCSDADIVRRYPQLSLPNLAAACQFVSDNIVEIENDLRQQNQSDEA